jgi:hypothetical protein
LGRRRSSARAASLALAGLAAAGLLALLGWWALANHPPRKDRAEAPAPEQNAPGPGPGLAGTAANGAGLQEADRGPLTVKLRVSHYEEEGKDGTLGDLGFESFAAHYLERVVVRVELSGPAHCFVISCNTDGTTQLLWPWEGQDRKQPGARKRPPPRLARFSCPPSPRPGPDGKKPTLKALCLDDDRRGGTQAFVVVASRAPLPAYDVWAKGRGPVVWQRLPAGRKVWWSNGEKEEHREKKGPVVRVSVVDREERPPMLRLCDWAQGQGIDAVQALAFPVRPREGD